MQSSRTTSNTIIGRNRSISLQMDRFAWISKIGCPNNADPLHSPSTAITCRGDQQSACTTRKPSLLTCLKTSVCDRYFVNMSAGFLGPSTLRIFTLPLHTASCSHSSLHSMCRIFFKPLWDAKEFADDESVEITTASTCTPTSLSIVFKPSPRVAPSTSHSVRLLRFTRPPWVA